MKPQYRVIIEKPTKKHEVIITKKDGFQTWEEANKYANKHTKKTQSFNVQTYWA